METRAVGSYPIAAGTVHFAGDLIDAKKEGWRKPLRDGGRAQPCRRVLACLPTGYGAGWRRTVTPPVVLQAETKRRHKATWGQVARGAGVYAPHLDLLGGLHSEGLAPEAGALALQPSLLSAAGNLF